jgi:uncharacterized membrane protein YeaQ/YmgE (transglycosylase-associated protein family)
MTNTILQWLEQRLTEASTYTGLAGLVATYIFHTTLNSTAAGDIGSITAGVLSGALIAITTKNPSALVTSVVEQVPNAVVVVSDLQTAHAALASGEPEKYTAYLSNVSAY